MKLIFMAFLVGVITALAGFPIIVAGCLSIKNLFILFGIILILNILYHRRHD